MPLVPKTINMENKHEKHDSLSEKSHSQDNSIIDTLSTGNGDMSAALSSAQSDTLSTPGFYIPPHTNTTPTFQMGSNEQEQEEEREAAAEELLNLKLDALDGGNENSNSILFATPSDDTFVEPVIIYSINVYNPNDIASTSNDNDTSRTNLQRQPLSRAEGSRRNLLRQKKNQELKLTSNSK